MLMSSDIFSRASGSVAGILNFRTRRNGRIDCSTSRGPGYARSPGQDNVRTAFGYVASYWQELTEEQKAAYHAAAVINQITDYDQFMLEHLSDEIAHGGDFKFDVSWFNYGRFV